MKDSRLQKWVRTIGVMIMIGAVTIVTMVVSGCASSEELSEEDLAKQQEQQQRQQELDSLRSVANMLRSRNSELEQNVRNLTGQVTDLQTKAHESEEKAKTAPAPNSAPVNIAEAEKTYNDAMAKFKKHNYEEALHEFDVLKDSATGQIKNNSDYWCGECLNGLKKYDEALKVFETVMDTKGSAKRSAAAFMIGRVYEHMKQNDKAKTAYQYVVDNFPTSEYVGKAKEEIDKLK